MRHSHSRLKREPLEVNSAQVGTLLATDSELANLMADGMMEWLVDFRYDRPSKEERSGHKGVHKKKVHAAMSMRLLCRELREAMDDRIVVWMRTYKSLMRSVHWHTAQTCLEPPRGTKVHAGLLESVDHPWHHKREEMLGAHREAQRARKLCHDRVLNHCGDMHKADNEWWLASTHAAQQSSWEAGRPIRADSLGEDPCTFFSMVAEQCQIQNGIAYGLTDVGFSKQARNVLNHSSRADTKFSVVRGTDGTEYMVHSREKNIDAVSCVPRSSFWSITGSISANLMLVQAMLHKAGVMPPYTVNAICRATSCWGRRDEWKPTEGDVDTELDRVLSHNGGRTRYLPRSFWPQQLLIARHPSLPAKTTSLQGALGLSDADMVQCKREADRKQAQKVQREQLALERHVEEMLEDVSATMAADERLPFASIEELQAVSPGIVATLRCECRPPSGERPPHALGIDAVQEILKVLRSFFNEVLEQNTDRHEANPSSGEAYAFVAGLHYGQYGPRAAHASWCSYNYAPWTAVAPRGIYVHANATTKKMYDAVKPIDSALRLFDNLDCSLCAWKSKETASGAPARQWRIVSKELTPSISCGCECEWLTHEQCLDFVACATALCAVVAPDCERLPKLFTKNELGLFRCARTMYMTGALGFQTGCIQKDSKAELAVLAAVEKVTGWYKESFRVLAIDPATRCAALDLIGLHNAALIDGLRCEGASADAPHL